MDSYRSTVVILFKDSAYTELDSNLADTFLNELSSLNDQFLLFHFNNLLTIKDSHDDYQLLEECASYVQIVYPRKQTFNIHDLRFVESCLQIIAQGEPHLSDRLYPISMLSACRHCELLIETLAVYMLDANENSKKASELMYLHVNTIRYRMEQIRKCFNESFSQMPLASALYQATALLRLLHR